MYLLGLDIGSSSIKATIINSDDGEVAATATSPSTEMKIKSLNSGWAEQDPEMWWENVILATQKLKSDNPNAYKNISAIGISYQMHGLVMVDINHKTLRPSIIWCDDRSVEIGDKAFKELGTEFCLDHFLNSPGNFTASKLKWVINNEPELFEKIHKVMLPGDFIAMKLTGEISTTIPGLSEGIMWDFKEQNVARDLLDYYGIDNEVLPQTTDTFSIQGTIRPAIASRLGLNSNVNVTYRAGDQPNNAFSLNVLNPGEIAANAGTSGVIYGINDQPIYDPLVRINTFVHVNHSSTVPRFGQLACLNGTGILNSWLKHNFLSKDISYNDMNEIASSAPLGADQVFIYPFGNGAERILQNVNVGARIQNLNFNRHTISHVLRAAQEGIVFALNMGIDIMREVNLKVETVRAGNANMFLSPLFRKAFANVSGAVLELYNTDGAQGAARGAGIGNDLYANFKEAFVGLKKNLVEEPKNEEMQAYKEVYNNWLSTFKEEIYKNL
ncbi:FGGY-family carbohydrate kinase [soil metagenome]